MQVQRVTWTKTTTTSECDRLLKRMQSTVRHLYWQRNLFGTYSLAWWKGRANILQSSIGQFIFWSLSHKLISLPLKWSFFYQQQSTQPTDPPGHHSLRCSWGLRCSLVGQKCEAVVNNPGLQWIWGPSEWRRGIPKSDGKFKFCTPSLLGPPLTCPTLANGDMRTNCIPIS